MIICGDSLTELKKMPSESVDCVITSPPYWALRDYGVEGQLGLEPTFQEYIIKLCDIFDEVKRVLKKEGTCWVNMGDTYNNSPAGNKNTKDNPMFDKGGCYRLDNYRRDIKRDFGKLQTKSLCQIPSRFAIEMCNRGWILRNEIIWHKPNCMPSSVKDRFTVNWEYVFFFTKSKKYYFKTQYEKCSPNTQQQGDTSNCPTRLNAKERLFKKLTGNMKPGGRILTNFEQGRNKRCVWTINTRPFKEAHFAVFPEALVETPIKAGCQQGGVVLDPFCGSGTTGVVATKLNRQFMGIDLNPKYVEMANRRIEKENGLFRTDGITK